jgi:hypothetical protein
MGSGNSLKAENTLDRYGVGLVTILGLDLELGSGYLTVTLNGLDGRTMNPQ